MEEGVIVSAVIIVDVSGVIVDVSGVKFVVKGVTVVVRGVGATHFNGVNMDAMFLGGVSVSNDFPVIEWTEGTTP